LKSAGAFSSNSKMISMQALSITVSTPEASAFSDASSDECPAAFQRFSRGGHPRRIQFIGPAYA
jgi:hypothetical protein